ncbi:uncharacterized protein LOC135582133 isoform X1 [Musa acuminata AAA Group]|uniref:uncharacterized protein LOC135582133 isoform X1 n=1 Tax=Musa acuminata AAA Group TaxID=214697 RepID=UPI0031DEB4A5
METAANANSSSSIPKNYVTLKQLSEKHDASITEKADKANSSSSIPNNYVTLKQLKEKHDASIMETAAKVNSSSSSSSSIPKNYVSLKHLQELRLKEKHDDEERLRNLKQEETEKKAAEERRKADELLIPKPHRRILGSRHKWPSNRQKWVVARLASPGTPDADGAKGSASGAVQVPPIGKSTGSDTNPEVGRKQNPKKKKKKKNKGKADREKNGGTEAAMAMATAEEESEEIKGSEKITADPSQENPVQVKEDGRRGRWTGAVNRSIGQLSGCGQERTVPTERRSVIVDDEAAAGAGRGRWTAARGGASNQRAGGFGRGRRLPDGAGLVWVRKTSST